MFLNGLNDSGSAWTHFRDKVVGNAKNKAVKSFKEKGLRVYLKTDLGKEILVYNSANVNNKSQNNGIIQYAVKVIDKNGKIITEYGQYPKTNFIKVAAISAVGLVGLWTLYKGVKNFY